MGASALSNESEGRRKWTTFGSMFIGWSFIYLCRKVFVTTMPQLIEYRGFDKQDLGAIASSFSLSYGLSKFFSAVLSDHVSPRMLLGAGVGLSGMCVLLFPLSTSLWLCCVMWFALGVVQGFGWPACTKLLKAWFPPTSVGTWWSILSSSGNLAAACAPVLITYTSTQTSWQSSYYVIGGLCCLVAAVFMVTVTDTPRQSNASLQQKKPQPTSRASWSFLIRSRELWLISIVYAILGNVKASLLDWGQLFFVDHAHFSNQSASTLIGATQVGGMLGSVVWGYVSDIVLSKMPKKSSTPRVPAMLICSCLLTFCLHLFITTIDMESTWVWASSLCFCLGLVLEGGVAMIGLLAMDCAPNHLQGTAHGIACSMAQVGIFLAGWPFSYATKLSSWTVAYQMVEAISLVMTLILLYLTVLAFRDPRPDLKAH